MDVFGMGSLGINQRSPTKNPIPWMQRLSTLLESRVHYDRSEEDEHWLGQIQCSTYENPYGIDDENGLTDLMAEVQQHNDESSFLSPGGSSSGAATATAHGSSLLSIGTDTGGSIRLPSAWTSTVGFKPSYGTFSRYGVVSYASSLDTIGYNPFKYDSFVKMPDETPVHKAQRAWLNVNGNDMPTIQAEGIVYE